MTCLRAFKVEQPVAWRMSGRGWAALRMAFADLKGKLCPPEALGLSLQVCSSSSYSCRSNKPVLTALAAETSLHFVRDLTLQSPSRVSFMESIWACLDSKISYKQQTALVSEDRGEPDPAGQLRRDVSTVAQRKTLHTCNLLAASLRVSLSVLVSVSTLRSFTSVFSKASDISTSLLCSRISSTLLFSWMSRTVSISLLCKSLHSCSS